MPDLMRGSVSLTIAQSVVHFDFADDHAPKCHTCRMPLGLDQPNAHRPDRLLGVCANCGNWEIFEVIGPGDDAWVTVLPRECWHDGRAGFAKQETIFPS